MPHQSCARQLTQHTTKHASRSSTSHRRCHALCRDKSQDYDSRSYYNFGKKLHHNALSILRSRRSKYGAIRRRLCSNGPPHLPPSFPIPNEPTTSAFYARASSGGRERPRKTVVLPYLAPTSSDTSTIYDGGRSSASPTTMGG